MATINLKGLNKVVSKGRTYYYVGRGRGAVRLSGLPGSHEFLASYETARNPVGLLDKRRLHAWVVLYRAKKFGELASSTQRTWRPWLDRIQEHLGDLHIRQFDRPQIRIDIRKWCDRWKKTPRTADFAKQVLSRVLAYAVEEGALQANPCQGMRNIYRSNRSDIIWKADDLAAFLRTASPEMGRVAQLAVLTGLRQGDLLKLGWSNVCEGTIEVRTGKSGYRRTATIPITTALSDLLATIPKRAATILTNARGLPWRALGSSWKKAMKDAGLAESGLHFHDLRGTAATNLYRADLSPREIADIMAWSPDRVERLIDRYVKRDELIRDRVRRIERIGKGT